MLVDLQVVRLRDQKQFRVPSYVLPQFTLRESDLERGAAEINVRPGGVFKIVALDEERRPIPRKKLHFTSTTMSSEITTDDNGEFIFLGNPTQYHFELTSESQGSFGLLIVPL